MKIQGAGKRRGQGHSCLLVVLRNKSNPLTEKTEEVFPLFKSFYIL